MTLACTSVEAFVTERDEPITKRFRQTVRIALTGAATDLTHDLGAFTAGSLGTLWTAIGADGAAGQAALGVLQSIYPSVKSGLGVRSMDLEAKTPVGSGATVATGQVKRTVTNATTNLAYFTAEAPTAPVYYLEYDLVDGCHGVKYPA